MSADPRPHLDQTVYLKAADVRRRYGQQRPVSRAWIARRIAHDGFPAGVKFGGNERFFPLEAVEAWERDQTAKAVQS